MHHVLPLLASALMFFPMGAQSVGFYRVQLGGTRVTALHDSQGSLPLDLLKGIDPAEAARLLGGAGPVATSTNAFLLETGGYRILVDAGREGGHLMEILAQAGVNPASIDAVLLTHLHPDHFAALLNPAGGRAFPRAQVRVAQAEHAYWTDPKLEAAAPEGRKPMFRALRNAIAAYGKAYRPFAAGEAPWPGVEALPIPGHTPGHTAFLFGHGPEALWVVGDLVHFEKIQFARPEVSVGFDADSAAAIRTRRAIWQRAAREQPVLAASHISFPGLGRVRAAAEGYLWVPVR